MTWVIRQLEKKFFSVIYIKLFKELIGLWNISIATFLLEMNEEDHRKTLGKSELSCTINEYFE